MSSGIRVLHVDDDEPFQDLAVHHLEREGFDVVTADCAEAALEALDGRVDCVVSDYEMPRTNGLELLSAVHDRDLDVPFILFTGKGSEEIASEAISAGVTDYLQKETTEEGYALLANRIERAVTERRTEMALEESERMLSTLVSNLPGIVYRCRNEPDWPVEYVGGDVRDVTGYEVERFYDDDALWIDRIVDGDFEDVRRTIQSALEAREPFEVTYRFVDADGETRWFREQGRGVYEAETADEPVAIEGFVTDVTDRKRRERELDEYGSLVDAMGDPVYTTDAHGNITRFNERALALTGYDERDVVGEHVSAILERSDVERGRAVIRELLESGEGTATYEITVETPGGESLTLENHVALLHHDGEFRGTIGVLRDSGQRPENRLRRLHDATRDLMSETDASRIAELTTAAAKEILGLPIASVRFEAGDVLELVAATDETLERLGGRPPFPVEGSIAGAAFTDGEPRVEPDVSAREDAIEPGDVESAAYFPLGDHGVLVIGANEQDAFDERDIQLATVLAANAEAAIDRARKDEALRRERDDLAALFENIPDPTIETVMVDGRPVVERVNAAFEDVFGYADEEIRGESLDAHIVPDRDDDRARRYNRRIEEGEGFHGEVRRLTDDGLRDFILHVVPHDVGHAATRGYAIYTDISDQKQRERRLERQNERIESLHEVAMRMKTASTREDTYDVVIDAAQEILEFDVCVVSERTEGVLRPRAVASDISLDDYDDTPVDTENNLSAESARRGETIVVDDLQAAGYVPVDFEYTSALTVPLGDQGVFQAVSEEAAAFDPSDRHLTELLAEHAVAAITRLEREAKLQRRAAALERQNERLDQFASVVSHDLRNPLSVARGRTDLARMTDEDEHFDAIDRAHDRMDELINGLLALARQGELTDDPLPVELENAAESAWKTAETEGLTLSFDDASVVEADPERLKQLLENLFRNAVEHGGPDVSTVTVGGLEGGFYVADDGVGIPSDERDGVFESGYSEDGGTGFGLAIVETIAEAHGWQVAVIESDEGGARFEFRDEPDPDGA